jgi:hypothetical protein
LKKTGLVVFDRKVVVGVTVSDQIVSDFALGQQGIGGHFFALNIDGIQERDGGFNLVGTLELFVVCGQSAYFFWV